MILEAGGGRGAGDGWSSEPAELLKPRESLVEPAERERRFGQVPMTLLLVGLTGSGKSRIAYALERRLWDEGRAVTVLYGQNMRQGLNRDLGFTADDRSENLRRSAEVAKLLNDAGLTTIAAFVAPHEAVREKAKQLIGRDRVLEVYCTAPMEVLRARDQSGAYRLADEGRIAQMPGRDGRLRGAEGGRPRAGDRPDRRRGERRSHHRIDEIEGLPSLAAVVGLHPPRRSGGRGRLRGRAPLLMGGPRNRLARNGAVAANPTSSAVEARSSPREPRPRRGSRCFRGVPAGSRDGPHRPPLVARRHSVRMGAACWAYEKADGSMVPLARVRPPRRGAGQSPRSRSSAMPLGGLEDPPACAANSSGGSKPGQA